MTTETIALVVFLGLVAAGLGWELCSIYRDRLQRRDREREERFRIAQRQRIHRTWQDFRLIRRDGRPVHDLPDLDDWADQARPANERGERG